eukprot:COSAG06_NODE_1293_length_9978_cov_25.200121_4_plen_387_part_00
MLAHQHPGTTRTTTRQQRRQPATAAHAQTRRHHGALRPARSTSCLLAPILITSHSRCCPRSSSPRARPYARLAEHTVCCVNPLPQKQGLRRLRARPRARFSSDAAADHMAHFRALQARLNEMDGVAGVAGGDHAVYHAVAEAQIGDTLHRLKTGHSGSTDEYKVSQRVAPSRSRPPPACAVRLCVSAAAPSPSDVWLAQVPELYSHLQDPATQAAWAPIVSLDPLGMDAARPSISATPANMEVPEIMARLRRDGNVSTIDSYRTDLLLHLAAARALRWSPLSARSQQRPSRTVLPRGLTPCSPRGRSSTRTEASSASRSPSILCGTSQSSPKPSAWTRICSVSGSHNGRRTSLCSTPTTRSSSRQSGARRYTSSAIRVRSQIPIAR